MPTEYERERDARIRRNAELLAQLGIRDGASELLGVPKPKPKPVQKRKTPPPSHSSGTESPEPAMKTARLDGDGMELRRSMRNKGKSVGYKKELAPMKTVVRKAERDAEDIQPNSVSERIHDPKTFGSIPDIEVGDWWETRRECSLAAVHAPWVGGISGSKTNGAYSIALSGGYEDDLDWGDGFSYTGAGGRDLKGTAKNPKNLRTAPQSSDQTFENDGNRALLVSYKTGKPVRVIRGFKLKSKYAPLEGYRYDGLYTVEKAWQEPGLNPKKCLVCKFILKRIPGQLPLTATKTLNDEDVCEDTTEDEDIDRDTPGVAVDCNEDWYTTTRRVK